jgi:putative Ca2+/H+ antiporter (TMEM165/GDT1 family)
MTAFWVSLFFVLIAEMGDKTQLVALAYATRYSTGTVMAGVFGLPYSFTFSQSSSARPQALRCR